MEKKYIVYQITNKLTNMIYIGVHVTKNINDSYMGSGLKIRKAIKDYGLEHFEKIILYQFDNEQEMMDKERELVNRNFISREDTYNVMVGGQFLSIDIVTVKDNYGNTSCVHKTDPRYISGELVHITTGVVTVKDKDEKIYQVNVNDPRYLSGELNSIFKGMITVKDTNNNYMSVSIDDPRYLSGELVPLWTGRKHTEEAKRKIGEANKSLVGEKNPSYGTCWITNNIINKNIKKEELDNYLKLNEGWKKGRINGNKKQPKF